MTETTLWIATCIVCLGAGWMFGAWWQEARDKGKEWRRDKKRIDAAFSQWRKAEDERQAVCGAEVADKRIEVDPANLPF